MSVLDFFKKKEEKPIPYKAKEKNIQPEKIKPEAPKKKSSGSLVLYCPHITEKATELEKDNKHIFRVLYSANKLQIKKAVRDIYGVEAVDVKIINVSEKKRRLGRHSGWKKGYKKAIVKLKQGQKIEIISR
ncbi:MAG: 50S ribosomal protein L23 [Candidatus Pacebacteria bacterium]|nr:50S ribosomal protein L23 [Candidatus Paceibacterota bacterium]